MPDTPKRLYGPLSLTATSAVLYTVPAGTTTIIRNIHVAVVSTAGGFTLGINSTSNAARLYSDYQIPIGGAFDWSGFLVLAAGESLWGLSSAGILNIAISGIEVS